MFGLVKHFIAKIILIKLVMGMFPPDLLTGKIYPHSLVHHMKLLLKVHASDILVLLHKFLKHLICLDICYILDLPEHAHFVHSPQRQFVTQGPRLQLRVSRVLLPHGRPPRSLYRVTNLRPTSTPGPQVAEH